MPIFDPVPDLTFSLPCSLSPQKVPPLPAQGYPSCSGNAPISEAFRFACQRIRHSASGAGDGNAHEVRVCARVLM